MSDSRQLNIRVNLDTGKLERDAANATNTLKGIGNEAETQGKRMTGVFKNVGAGLAAAFAVERVKNFIGEIINVRSEIQSLSVSFETLLGSKEKADELFGQIRRYAANTPMQMNDLAQGAQTLLGFNIEAKKVMPIMQAIGDISMGNRDKFNSLTLAFAQMSATGKLMGQDLLQMVNAGFNPLTIISEKTGKSMSTLREEMSAGSISAKMIEDAFIAATAEGSKFHGMLDQQSKTLRGSISSFQGAFTDMLNDFGESSEGIIAGGVNAAYTMVKNYKDTAEALLVLIGVVGAYKAALIVNQALEAAALDTAHAKVAAIGAVNAAQATGFELEVQQAVAKRALKNAEAEELLMQYELAKARVADLTALKVQAQAEKESAIATQAAATAKVQAAEQQVIAANMKYEAALRSGNGEKIERAELALGTAQSELNAASKAHMTAMTNTAVASKKASVAATTAETAAQELNTLSMNTGSKAAGFLTLAKTQLLNTTRKLYATMAANPLGLAFAAVIALGYAIYKLKTHMSDAEKANKAMGAAHVQARTQIATEERDIKKLFDTLKKSKEGTEAYKKAKEDIWSRYGKYLKVLGDENTALNDQAKAYALVAKKAREAAMAKAKDAFMETDEAKAITNKVGEAQNKVFNLIEKKYGKAFVDRHEDEIYRVLSGDSNVNPEFLKKFNTTEYRTAGASSVGYTQTYAAQVNYLQQYLNEVKEANKEVDDLQRKADHMFGTAKDPGDGAADVTVNFNKELDSAKKTLDTTKKNWQELAKSTSSTKAQVEAAYKAYKTAQSTYDDLLEMKAGKQKKTAGLTAEQIAAREENAAGKLADILRKQGQERLRIEQDYEYERWQSRINLMKEGEARILEQQRLDFDREKTELGRRLESELEAELNRQMAVFNAEQDALAAGNRKYARKTFRDSDIDEAAMKAIRARYAALQEDLTKAQRKVGEDRIQAAKESFDAYLKEFGSYQQKREAIQAEYAKLIETAPDRGARMTAMANRNKALADLDFSEWQEGGGMALAFGDISKLSKDTVSGLIDDMERYRSKIIATFDPEKIQKYEEALNNLRMAESASGSFLDSDNDVLQGMRERLAIQRQLADEEANEVELKRQKAEIEMRLAALKMTPSLNLGTAPDGEQMTAPSAPTQEDILLADELRVRLDAIDNALKSSGINSAQLRSQLQALGKVRFSDIEKFSRQIQKAGENAAGFASIFSDDVAEGISEATGMLGGMTDAFAELSSGINALARSGREVVEKTAKASGDIVESASAGMKASAGSAEESLSAMEKASAILAIIGAAIQMATMIASLVNPDRKHERNIEALQKRIDDLDRSCDKLGKSIAKAYSYDASALIEQQETLLRQQKALVAQQMQEELSKKKSDDDKVRRYREQIEDLDEAIADAKESAKDAIFGDDLKSQIEDFASAYSEAWGSGESRVMSARDTVRRMMRQMAEESIKAAIQGSGAMERIRQTLADFYSDNILTAGEQDYVYGLADELQKELDARFGQQADLLSNTYSQNPTAKGWDTFTQEQADVLTGRFTAFCETSEAIRGINAGIAESVKSSLLLASAQRDLMQDALNIHIVNMGHLEAISKNTRELATIREDLGKIERYVRNL